MTLRRLMIFQSVWVVLSVLILLVTLWAIAQRSDSKSLSPVGNKLTACPPASSFHRRDGR